MALTIVLTGLVILTALGAALIGGVFFAFSTFVMRALGERPAAEGLAAMRAVNRVILRSAFIPVFFATAVLALGLAVYGGIVRSEASGWLLSGALAYLAGSIWVTIAFNVPLNVALDRAGEAEEEALWKDYLVRWTRWNHVRTLACLASAVLFIVALVV